MITGRCCENMRGVALKVKITDTIVDLRGDEDVHGYNRSATTYEELKWICEKCVANKICCY